MIQKLSLNYKWFLPVLVIAALFGIWKNDVATKRKYKILILWTGAGEKEWAKRLEIVCNRLQWECKTLFCSRELSDLEQSLLADSAPSTSLDQITKEFHPDLVVSLSKRCQLVPSNLKSYLAISGDNIKIFEATCSDPEDFFKFDGLLHASSKINQLKAFIASSGRDFRGIAWYPSCPATKYVPTVPKRLFYCGFQWDNKRNGEEYKKMFSLLDRQGYLDVYGPIERWECAPNSRRGSLPFDGQSVVKAIRQSGIALVLHAQSHLDLEAPTGRIFEAASACSVIISDRNPFIVREFGDSVLYIDDRLDAETLFSQIDNHVKWILSHPSEAQKMAKKAHSIFLKKFTLEKQIKDLIELHLSTSKPLQKRNFMIPVHNTSSLKADTGVQSEQGEMQSTIPTVGNSHITKDEFLNFCHQNRSKLYQDIFINGEVLLQGVNICDKRYDIVRSILQPYNGHFSLLDLGAAQGYFSFKIGTEFPKAHCVMVEHFNDKEKHYGHHQDMLYQLCHLNSHLNNISYLHQEISVPILEDLNQREHFDFVLAMLVIHQVDKNMPVRIKCLDNLLKLGDNVLLELSNDVAPELLEYVSKELVKSETHECKCLGEVQRCYDPSTAYGGYYPNGKGIFYLFTRKQLSNESFNHLTPQKIKHSTYKAMNGIYTSALLED